ncbi:hypothetical protein HOL34_00340 [bacterium]|jgi:hypothetical protein|nr:hypothetical protein [bacterium]MBT3903210.1 hypothetical protein [bacterium]MBT4578155.1 hypothetical protein [bacterium]MBT5345499.1 hypothetical protein [bacterium]MBT6131193.1 hypothetical protein [bacterium]
MSFIKRFFQKSMLGFKMAIQGFIFIKKHPSLLIFPVVAVVIIFTIIGLILAALVASVGLFIHHPHATRENVPISFYIIAALAIFVSALVINVTNSFFSVAQVQSTVDLLNGKQTSFTRSLGQAFSRLGTIIVWSLIATIVGIVINNIRSKNSQSSVIAQFLRSILAKILVLAWQFSTYFVIPIITLENISIVKTIESSYTMMKKTFGNVIGAQASFGLVSFLATTVIGGPLALIAWALFSWPGAVVIATIVIVITSVITKATETVFKTAVYQMVHERNTGPFSKQEIDQHFIRGN